MILRSEAETKQGLFAAYAFDDHLIAVALPETDRPALEKRLMKIHGCNVTAGEPPVLLDAMQQLQDYCVGGLRNFEVPLKMEGTEFQIAVWQALLDIPYGETVSYADIALQIGRPGAARAVGQANRVNPLPVIVPCHRVVAADGGLGGYMGAAAPEAGLKASLLRLEGQFL